MGVVLYLLVIDLNIPGPATDVDTLYYPHHLLSQWLVVSTYDIPLSSYAVARRWGHSFHQPPLAQ